MKNILCWAFALKYLKNYTFMSYHVLYIYLTHKLKKYEITDAIQLFSAEMWSFKSNI